MQSLEPGYRALVIGSSGGIGSAITARLRLDPRCGEVLTLARVSSPGIDYRDESSIGAAADAMRAHGPLDLIFVATGMLGTPVHPPEKRMAQINYAQMLKTFTVNTFGPAAVLAHFSPLLTRQRRAIVAVLSAKVGSIGDNRLGGWYSYRASKAALNMILKTAAIELGRTHPRAVLAALHPGTVDTALSASYATTHPKRAPEQAALDLLGVLDGLQPEQSGGFWSYAGEPLPW